MANVFSALEKYQRTLSVIGHATSGSRPRSRLRILHVSLSSDFGGRELRILHEMLAMRERGHHLEVGCAARSELGLQAQRHGFTAHAIEAAGTLASASVPLQITRVMRAGDFDVANTHSVADDLRTALFVSLARTRLVVRTHHRECRNGVPRAFKALSNCVMTVSDYQRQRYLGRGYTEHCVRTVHTGLDVQDPLPGSPSMRENLGIPADAMAIGALADELDPGGLRTLVEATCPLMQAHAGVHLVLGNLREPQFTQLMRRALEIGLLGKIHCPGHSLSAQKLLAEIDIYAMVPELEVKGSTFIEACARGVPVIATAVGCIPEIIDNGVSGYVVLPFDRLALRCAIGRLLEDSNVRVRFGEAGRAKFLVGRFSAAGMAQAVEGAYLEWLKVKADAAGTASR